MFFFQRGLCTLVSLTAAVVATVRCRVGIGPRTLLERGQTSCQYPVGVGVVVAVTMPEREREIESEMVEGEQEGSERR